MQVYEKIGLQNSDGSDSCIVYNFRPGVPHFWQGVEGGGQLAPTHNSWIRHWLISMGI